MKKTENERSIEELMTLLADVTEWGDQCLSVKIGYKRAREYYAVGESFLDDNDWGFVATTETMHNGTAEGQGKTLNEALYQLALNVHKKNCSALRNAERTHKASERVVLNFTTNRSEIKRD